MTRTALIVDDEADIRGLCDLNLRFCGWSVVEAGSLAAGLQALDEVTPDWVILDIRLRDGSGLTLLRELRSRPDTRAVPVLLLTADGKGDALLSCWEPGLLELLPKPFLPADLIATAARVGTFVGNPDSHAERVLSSLG